MAGHGGAFSRIGLLRWDGSTRLARGTVTHGSKLVLDVRVRLRVDGGLIGRCDRGFISSTGNGRGGGVGGTRTHSLTRMTCGLGHDIEGVGLMPMRGCLLRSWGKV